MSRGSSTCEGLLPCETQSEVIQFHRTCGGPKVLMYCAFVEIRLAHTSESAVFFALVVLGQFLSLVDLRSLVRFVSFWKKRAKSEQAKSNHL